MARPHAQLRHGPRRGEKIEKIKKWEPGPSRYQAGGFSSLLFHRALLCARGAALRGGRDALMLRPLS